MVIIINHAELRSGAMAPPNKTSSMRSLARNQGSRERFFAPWKVPRQDGSGKSWGYHQIDVRSFYIMYPLSMIHIHMYCWWYDIYIYRSYHVLYVFNMPPTMGQDWLDPWRPKRVGRRRWHMMWPVNTGNHAVDWIMRIPLDRTNM